MDTLFINGSPNKSGATVRIAETLLAGKPHGTLHLADKRIYCYGQDFADDEFPAVLDEIRAARTLVIGSPVYWHNLSGSVRVLLERLYGSLERGGLSGKRLALVFQGAAPEKWMIDAGEYSVKMLATLYGMEYLGMAQNEREAKRLAGRM